MSANSRGRLNGNFFAPNREIKYAEPGNMAKNHAREIRAQKQNHEQTHRYVPYRQNTVPIGAILLRNLAFFAVGRPHCPGTPSPQLVP